MGFPRHDKHNQRVRDCLPHLTLILDAPHDSGISSIQEMEPINSNVDNEGLYLGAKDLRDGAETVSSKTPYNWTVRMMSNNVYQYVFFISVPSAHVDIYGSNA